MLLMCASCHELLSVLCVDVVLACYVIGCIGSFVWPGRSGMSWGEGGRMGEFRIMLCSGIPCTIIERNAMYDNIITLCIIM